MCRYWCWRWDNDRISANGYDRNKFTLARYYQNWFDDLTRGDYWRYDNAPWTDHQKVARQMEIETDGKLKIDWVWVWDDSREKFSLCPQILATGS